MKINEKIRIEKVSNGFIVTVDRRPDMVSPEPLVFNNKDSLLEYIDEHFTKPEEAKDILQR